MHRVLRDTLCTLLAVRQVLGNLQVVHSLPNELRQEGSVNFKQAYHLSSNSIRTGIATYFTGDSTTEQMEWCVLRSEWC